MIDRLSAAIKSRLQPVKHYNFFRIPRFEGYRGSRNTKQKQVVFLRFRIHSLDQGVLHGRPAEKPVESNRQQRGSSARHLLGFLIGEANIRLRVIPGHPDAVAGLKPVGNFYFRQAMVVGIPAIFLAVWLVLIPLPYFQSYAGWQKSYRGLLVLAIIFEALSFMVPLWWFHGEMSKQKRILLKEADELSAEIAQIQRNLVEAQSIDEMKAFKEKLEEKTARYLVIEQLPVWPIDLKTKRLFSISNIALVVPLVSEYAGLSKPWAEFVKGSLEKIGSQ
jgi:hypothetical protein